MKDDRDFLERAGSIMEKACGEPVTVAEIADNFSLYGLSKRVAALDKFDAELTAEIDSGSHNLRHHVRLAELRRRMAGVHHALRKAKR